MSQRLRRSLFAAAGVGLALRLAFALGYWVDKPLTRDELEYLSLARSIAHGQGVTYDAALNEGSVIPFGRAPGYPTFLALVGGGRTVSAVVPTAVKVAQSIVGALTVLLFGMFAARLAGPRAGMAAGWIAAAYPPLVWMCSYALSEVVYVPVGLVTILLFDRIPESHAPGATVRASISGLVAGLGLLLRAAMTSFVPLALVWLVWRRGRRAAMGFAIGVAMVVLPWTARNYAVYHRFVLIASDGGVTLWTGNNPLARGEGDQAANPELKAANQQLRSAHPGLTEEAMEPVYYNAATTWIRAHPLDWIGLEGRKLFYMVVPIGPSYTVHSRAYYGASLASYLTLLPFGVYGFVRLGRRAGATPGLWLLLLSSVGVCLVFFPQERFRLPVIDPVLIVGAAAAVARIRERAS